MQESILTGLPKLKTEMIETLDTPIDVNEVELHIKEMKNGESPGPDGLPAGFYKKWSKKLAPILLNVFKESYRNKCLPPIVPERQHNCN
uniref:Putative line-1 reverse transcriptase n=1 Tax=Ixodes ricinus TaxID=34613 RepID=A0A0K8R7I5_IXORI